MNASDTDISAHVVIRCPGCGAYESAELGALADQSVIVCRECGETWPAGGRAVGVARPQRPSGRGKHAQGEGESRVLVAERRPLVTYSGADDKAWRAKIEGDYWPEPRQHSRLPMTIAAMAALFFLAAFFGGREAAVAALPDLAGLYSAIGMPVNLAGFAIEDVGAERTRTFAGPRIIVRATIRNLGTGEAAVPALAAILFDASARPAGAYGFDPPPGSIPAGQSMPILLDLETAPDNAADVALRFRRPGETLPAAGEAQLAALP